MKKIHYESLKNHTIYTAALAIVFLAICIITKELSLVAVSIFLILYVSGNGIIHSRTNKLGRDTLVEYAILAVIAFVLLFGATK